MRTTRPVHDILFAHDFPPMGGGIARWMQALASFSPPGSLVVSTGTVHDSAEVDAQSTQPVIRVPIPVDRLRTLTGGMRWARGGVALARDPAARFAWCDTIRPAGYAAHRAWRATGLPYGIMVVGNDVLTLREKIRVSRFKRMVMRRVLGNASVIVAISQWTARQCAQLLDELQLDSENRIRIVPLGTDPDAWRFDASAAASFRERRNLGASPLMLTVARLVDYKGIDLAITALAALSDRHSALRYVVVGRGPDEQRLRQHAQDLGVADRVHLLTDVTDDELIGAYSAANLYVGLTRETPMDVEGFGISFAEASACERPVVAANAGGIPDAVVDGATGVLVDPLNGGAVCAAIGYLLSDPTAAHAMGSAGRRRVDEYLNWERVTREMRAIATEFGRKSPA